MRRLLCSIAILIGLALPCAAQQAVLQSGPWTQGHAPLYVGQGSSQPVVQDSGTAAGGALGTGLTELGLTIFNPNLTPPYANAGTGPYGTNFCDYDAPTNNATGFHYLCFSPNAQGGGLIAYGAGGVASPLPLQFIINGLVEPFSNIPANCATPNGIAYYLSGGGVGCSSGITASNSALTLGSGTTLTLPDTSTWTSAGLSALRIGSGSSLTSTGPGGALGSNAFTSMAYLPAAAGAPTGYINVTASPYGATGNTLSYADGTITSGTNIFTSNSATFTSEDVGKSIVVDYAGAAGAPLVTTIASYVSAHEVTLAVNASTTVPYEFVNVLPVATAQSGGGNYAPGDTVTMAGGTSTTAAVGAVRLTKVVSATVVTGGAYSIPNGTTTGNCTVSGTTGSGGTPFTLSVALVSGAINSINSIVFPGQYSTNPTTLTNEPVVTGLVSGGGAGSCSGSGGAVSIVMGIEAIGVTTAGVYSVIPATFTQSTTSGSGTGATFTGSSIIAGGFVYGTDDTSAFNAAIAAALNANLTAGTPCIFVPAGAYMITSSLTTFYHVTATGSNGCIIGTGSKKSWIYVHPSLSGPVFSWSRNFNFTQSGGSGPLNGATQVFTGVSEGPRVQGLSVVGDRTSSNTQNAFVFYDENQRAILGDLEVFYLNGSAIQIGQTLNSTNAYLAESWISNIRAFSCGTSTAPCIDIYSQGSGQGTNEVKFENMDIFSPFGNGVQIHGTGDCPGLLSFVKLRIEGLQYDPVNISNDLLEVGDTTGTCAVVDVKFTDLQLLDGYPGYAAMHLTASGSGTMPYLINVTNATIGGGEQYSQGLRIDYGRLSAFDFKYITTNDTNVVIGSGTSTGLEIKGAGGTETSWTWNVANGAQATIAAPIYRYGAPYNSAGGTSISWVFRDSTPWGTISSTNGTVFLPGVSGTHAYSGAVGAGSTLVGGSGNQTSGANSSVFGGAENTTTGTYGSIPGGAYGTDRSWYGGRAFASGSLSDFNGDANHEDVVLRCQAAASNASTCRATSDNSTPGSTDVVNIPNNAAYTVTLDCAAIDRTTVGNNESWNAVTMLLTRGANAASTALSIGSATPSASYTNGTVTGSGIDITADTTNGGLNVTFTAPSTNSHLWDFTCHAATHQVQ